MSEERFIVDIAVNEQYAFALADDGSLWRYSFSVTHWERIPDLPSETDPDEKL